MIILGIETSCDETGAAILSYSPSVNSGSVSRIQILSKVLASSASLQTKYGGVIPEKAAREQLKSIIPVIKEALTQSNLYPLSSTINPPAIDAIAVTQGPGLIGSLLIGVETAKTLSLIWNKPLIPINHLIAHFYANWINEEPPSFPAIGLLVSGGHTDLILLKDHGKFDYLGGTRDDAAGECFDKCARLLGLPYPGGPAISKLAAKGNPKAYDLPRPLINSKDFDFSYSGLKTAVARLTSEVGFNSSEVLADLSASIEAAIIEPLVKKTVAAAQKYNIENILVAGGVAANQSLVSNLQFTIYNLQKNIKLFVPSKELCTDNAVIVAAAAFFLNKPVNPLTLDANPNLSLAY